MELGRAALDPYEQFVRERPADALRVQQLVDEGRTALESGEGERARGLFVRALSIFPWVPPALTNLAALALQRDEKEQAWQYLSELFRRFPDDPAGNGVAIRYWLSRGSVPMAYYHGRRALAGLRAQAGSDRIKRDPSSWQRAALILLSTFASVGADDLICDLYALAHELEWDATSLLTFGIAFYNRGEIDQAETLWEACGEDERALRYVELLGLNREEVLPPFRLDYQLSARMPTLEELQQLLQTQVEDARPFRTLTVLSEQGEAPEARGGPFHLFQALRYAVAQGIPSLAVLDGIRHILTGTEEQAELAMGMLFLDRWPHLGELLRYAARRADRPMRIRLGAVLYLLWIQGQQAARETLAAVDNEASTETEHLLVHIVRLQVALAAGDLEEADEALRAAEIYLEQAGTDGEEWLPLLRELRSHYERLTGKGTEKGEPASERKKARGRGRQVPDNVILFPTDRGARNE